jgi:hypothetical protein
LVILRPTRIRWPTVSGITSPKTARHRNAAISPPPDMRPSPRRAGHQPSSVIARETSAMIPPETSRMRNAVTMARLTWSSVRGALEPATALITTAAMPRSAKGRRVGKVLRRPYWA